MEYGCGLVPACIISACTKIEGLVPGAAIRRLPVTVHLVVSALFEVCSFQP
jgi:hypothetical protein